MQWRTCALATALVCAATAASATGENAGPFIGEWTITEAKPAPWITPTNQPNAALLNAKINFGRGRVDAPAPFACARVTYYNEPRGADTIFAGNLSEPEKQAREMGFPSGRIVTLSTGCTSGESLLIPDVVMADAHTAMFLLDNYIYVMKR